MKVVNAMFKNPKFLSDSYIHSRFIEKRLVVEMYVVISYEGGVYMIPYKERPHLLRIHFCRKQAFLAYALSKLGLWVGGRLCSTIYHLYSRSPKRIPPFQVNSEV